MIPPKANDSVPAGYATLQIGSASVVAHESLVNSIPKMLAAGSILDFASASPNHLLFQGRGAAIAFDPPDGGPKLLVRRNRHGGALAGITGDYFIPPGRAPRELSNALKLQQRGVATPSVMGYVVYPALLRLCRIDVLLGFLDNGRDLATLLLSELNQEVRKQALSATSNLMSALAKARAHHPDLNLRNVLVTEGDTCTAWVLDLDVVTIDSYSEAAAGAANSARILRSARKLAASHQLRLSDAEAHMLTAEATGR